MTPDSVRLTININYHKGRGKIVFLLWQKPRHAVDGQDGAEPRKRQSLPAEHLQQRVWPFRSLGFGPSASSAIRVNLHR